MSHYSILRSEEEKYMAQLSLTGSVLDLGGHKLSGYHELIKTTQPIEVVNLDEHQPGTHQVSSRPDYVFDLEKTFPLEDDSFDNILAINVMEHIYNFHNLISESSRIIKRGGTIAIAVPFFFNVHGSPDDYFRYTGSTLEKLLTENGFKEIEINELGHGFFSAVFQTIGGSLPTMVLKQLVKSTCIGIDKLLLKIVPKYARVKQRIPLGYFVYATKG